MVVIRINGHIISNDEWQLWTGFIPVKIITDIILQTGGNSMILKILKSYNKVLRLVTELVMFGAVQKGRPGR